MKDNKITKVEYLMEMLKELREPKDEVTELDDQPNNDKLFNAMQLAMKIEKRGKGFIFRAIYEEWDYKRIYQEIY